MGVHIMAAYIPLVILGILLLIYFIVNGYMNIKMIKTINGNSKTDPSRNGKSYKNSLKITNRFISFQHEQTIHWIKKPEDKDDQD